MDKQPDESTPVLTTAEAARYLRLSEDEVRARARRGELPSMRLGHRSRRYSPEALEAYLARHATSGEDRAGDWKSQSLEDLATLEQQLKAHGGCNAVSAVAISKLRGAVEFARAT